MSTPERKPAQAAALGYDRDRDRAPRVLARGSGEIAQNILERAAAHGIPIERDPDLLACLAPLQVGQEIPVAAYTAVAHILAFLYAHNREA
jgi:flagellar biosynthesis protein